MRVWGFSTAVPMDGSMAGGTVYFHQVAKRFVELGHEVTIQVRSRSRRLIQDLDLDGVKYRREASPKDADVILLHSASLEANPPLFQFRKPIIYILHSHSPLIKEQLECLKPKDYLISNSLNMAETVSKLGTKHRLIYPITDNKYKDNPSKNRFYITTVGSSIIKNIGLFYNMAAKYPHERFLHIKGGYGNDRCGRPMNLAIVSNVTDLRPYYQKTRVLIVPSFSETYSLVAREAGLQGIPVICSDVPGLRENLGDTGLYADPNDVRTFMFHLNKLNNNSAYYREVATKIKVHCEAEEEKNLKRLDDLINEL